MTIPWPALAMRSPNLVPRNGWRSGGTALDGSEQRVASQNGKWELQLGQVRLNDEASNLGYRNLLTRLRAGEDTIAAVPERFLMPGARLPGAAAAFGGAALLRATTVGIVASVIRFVPGGRFCVGGERIHEIDEVLAGPTPVNDPPADGPWTGSEWSSTASGWRDAVTGPASWSLRIWPPLRGAVEAGAAISCTALALRCKLADAGNGDPDLDLGRFGRPTLTLVEHL